MTSKTYHNVWHTICQIVCGQSSAAVTRKGNFSLSCKHLVSQPITCCFHACTLPNVAVVPIVIIIACYENFSSLLTFGGFLVACDTVKYSIVRLLSIFANLFWLPFPTAAAPEIWIEQSGFSRREKVCCFYGIEIGFIFFTGMGLNIHENGFTIPNYKKWKIWNESPSF